MLLTIVALLGWKFWPEKNTATITATVATTPMAAPPVTSKMAVEAPIAAPAKILSIPNDGNSLYEASKDRAAAPGSAGTGDDDFATIVKGSPELAKLDKKLAQNAALAHSLTPTGPTARLPMVVTELGKITLTEGKPELRKLASGDEAILTLVTYPTDASGDKVIYGVTVNFLNPNADGSYHDTGLQASTMIQFGQGAMIRNIPTGNEIHFVPELASPAGPSQ